MGRPDSPNLVQRVNFEAKQTRGGPMAGRERFTPTIRPPRTPQSGDRKGGGRWFSFVPGKFRERHGGEANAKTRPFASPRQTGPLAQQRRRENSSSSNFSRGTTTGSSRTRTNLPQAPPEKTTSAVSPSQCRGPRVSQWQGCALIRRRQRASNKHKITFIRGLWIWGCVVVVTPRSLRGYRRKNYQALTRML